MERVQGLDFNKMVEDFLLQNYELSHKLQKSAHDEIPGADKVRKLQNRLYKESFLTYTSLALTAVGCALQTGQVANVVMPSLLNRVTRLTAEELSKTLQAADAITNMLRHTAENRAQAIRTEAGEETSHLRTRYEQAVQENRKAIQDVSEAVKKLEQAASGEHNEKMGIAR